MNKLLKYGMPSLLGLLLATPVMAQTGYANQTGQNGYENGYQGQHWNNQFQGQTGNWRGQNGWESGENRWNNGNQWNGSRNFSENGAYSGEQNSGWNGSGPLPVTRGFIARVQRRLQQQGFYHQGSVDGMWGPETQDALRSFQQQHNLRPTGQINMRTLETLNMANGQNSQQYGQNGYQIYHQPNSRGQDYSSNYAGTGSGGGTGYGGGNSR